MKISIDGRSAYAYTGSRSFDSARPTVAFAHGAQNDHSVWMLQSRYLAHHGWNVLAWDLPGHGRSEGPALSSIEAMADWLVRACAAAGAARSVLVGHSMGSLIALHAGGAHPQAVMGVALVGTAFPMKVSDALLQAARDDEPKAMAMINQWSFSGVTHRRPNPGFSVFHQNRRLMQRQPPGVLLNDFNACNAYTDGLQAAGRLQCPALLVLGGADQMTPPRAARALQQAIKNAQTLTLPGVGHGLMYEDPQGVQQALAAFLKDLAARP